MYEESFGTDWDDIDDREEAVTRAFALGVAARLGERHPGELDRISAAVDSTYDRSFVEMAYHEGRDKASEVEPDADSDDDVWDRLVEGETEIDPNERPGSARVADESDVPDFLDAVDIDSRPADSREAMARPKFLTREEAEEPDGRSRSRRRRGGSDDKRRRKGTEPTDEEREALQEILDPGDDEEES